MAKAPQRTPVAGPAFIRLLARLADAELPASSPALADRVTGWIDWNRAVALSKALDRPLPTATAGAPVFEESDVDEYTRVRAALVSAIAVDIDPIRGNPRKAKLLPQDAVPAPLDYASLSFTPFRERYRDLQQTMQAATGKLRGQLRDLLASASPGLARLAEVDSVMDMTLSPREQELLGTVPELLGQHFERLQQHAPSLAENGSAAAAEFNVGPPAWVQRFQQDMRDVLLAELDVRFQPVDGLLAALRTR